MANIELVRPTKDGLKYIADNMRAADAAEVWASNRFTPYGALLVSVEASDHLAMVVADGEPIAVLGLKVHDILTGSGVPWLLGTESALKHKRQFFELSPPVIQDMLNQCPKLFNYVHTENRVSIRWLKWLGFEIEEAEPFGPEGELFHRFTMEKKDV